MGDARRGGFVTGTGICSIGRSVGHGGTCVIGDESIDVTGLSNDGCGKSNVISTAAC